MRVAGFTEPVGPDVLRVLELPVLEAGPGEVRVRVAVAGVQPFDLAVREGWSPSGTPEGFPRVPGNEFAGVVDAAGGQTMRVQRVRPRISQSTLLPPDGQAPVVYAVMRRTNS